MSLKNLMKIGGIIAVLLGTTPMIAVAQQSGRNYDNPPAVSVRVASNRSGYHRHYYRGSNRYYRHSHRYYGNSDRYYGNSHRYVTMSVLTAIMAITIALAIKTRISHKFVY